MSLKQRFASAVYHARLERKLTQAQAAEELDISLRWYQRIEYGHHWPSAKLALKIMAHFEIDGKILKAEPAYVSLQDS